MDGNGSMMDQIRQCRELLWALVREARSEMERESREFLDPLQNWVNELVQRRLPADWRERLESFLAPWEAEGFRLTPESVQTLVAWIEAWAEFRALLPVKTAAMVSAGTSTTADAPRPFVIHVTPNVSGPPDPSIPKSEGVELAGPGPETSPSFKVKVQAALEILDPVVAGWWKRPSVSGIVRSRDATSWFKFLRFNFYSEAPKGGQVLIVVDQNFNAGQTAAAIVYEARVNVSANSLGPRFREDMMWSGDPVKEYQRWRSESFAQAAGQAAMLAEIYVKALASVTPGGQLVVTVDDVATNGVSWDQLVLLLPLMAHVPKGVKFITLVTKKFTARLPVNILHRLETLPDRGKAIFKSAEAAASSEGEFLAIIERELAPGRQHHIATNKNWISTLRGGPWSPKFERIFKKAGLTLEDAANKIRIPGHRGPNPREYHEEIYERLTIASEGLSGEKLKKALLKTLDTIAVEAMTPGTKLNYLLTH